MRGVRSFTLVPSLSVSTNSETGTGLSEAAYFGFAIMNDEYNSLTCLWAVPPRVTRGV